MEADPSFAYKLCVECGLDAAIILSVNLATRKDKFLSQLEFVGCQARMGTALTVRIASHCLSFTPFLPSIGCQASLAGVAAFSDALSLRHRDLAARTIITQPEPVGTAALDHVPGCLLL